MDCLVHPCYFPSIAHFIAMYNAQKIYLELWDNYQKQTFRNRSEIYGANGKLNLTVPVVFTQKNRQRFKDVKIFNSEKWQQQHLKSLHSAYSTSPFFEFYIDELMPIFEKSFCYLMDLNLLCLEIIQNALQLEFKVFHTTTFQSIFDKGIDLRRLVNPKQQSIELKPYAQMFSEKHGFMSNLSILDLLFNEGPATELYLSEQKTII